VADALSSTTLLVALYGAAFLFWAWTRWPLLHDGLWRDDGISIAIASGRMPGQFLERLSFLDSQPPLHHFLLGLWGRLFGFGEVPMKAWSFGWGFASTVMLGVAAADLFGAWAGAFTLLLLVNHPMLMLLPGDVRPYSLTLFLVGLTLFILFGRWSQRSASSRFWRLTPVLLLLEYCQYTGTLAVVVIGAFAIVGSLRGATARFWRPVLASCSVAGLLFVPWLPWARRHSQIGLPWDPILTLGERIERLASRAMKVFPWMTLESVGLFGSLGFVVLLAAGLAAGRRAKREAGFPFSALMVAAAAAAAIFLVMSLVTEPLRYLTISAALGCVVAGGMMATIPDFLEGQLKLLTRVAVLAIVAGAFLSSRRDFADYFDRVGQDMPKSAARSFCLQPVPDRTWILAVPDFIATSVRYYCGPRVHLVGFPQWDAPELPHWDGYRVRLERVSVGQTVSRLEGLFAEGKADTLLVLWLEDRPFLRLFPNAREPLARLAEALDARYAPGQEHLYPGGETFRLIPFRRVINGAARPSGIYNRRLD
jgi:hypothetical protein